MSTATQQGTTVWTLDAAHTQAQFEVKHMMFARVRGHFRELEGTVTLPESGTAGAVVRATLQTASVDTGQAQRDEHLRSADFFDVAAHPTITFESRNVRETGKGHYAVAGDLTIRGVTRPVELAVEETGRGVDPWGNQRVGFTATTTIDRRDFGLVWNQALEAGGVLVGTDVTIRLEVQAVRSA